MHELCNPTHIQQPLSLALPHWRHLLCPGELYWFIITIKPWKRQFEVLTLLPLSESTVSCWESISMRLPRNASSSTLAFASPIVLPEIVICGGCPNFIFLANCCWKTKRGRGKKSVFRLWAKQAKSPTCAPSPHGSSTEILRTTSGSRPSWGSCCCSMVAPPSLFAPTEWPRTGIHYLSSGSGWSASVFISAANLLWILWILQLSIYFHNLCPRLRLLIKLFNYQDLPSQRNDNITTQMYPQGIQTAQFLVPTWIPIQVSLRNTEAYSRYHIEQECIFFYTTESWTWLRWTAGKGRNPVIALGRPLKGFKSDQPSFQRCSVDNILA